MEFTPTSKMCSFCGTQGSEDTRLAGGLGAWMCRDCLAHYAEVFASEDTGEIVPRRSWDEMSDADALATLPTIIRSAEQADDFAADWVDLLRERGIAWAAIGKALGVSRQAAWAKYGRRDAAPRDGSVEAG